MSTSTRLERVWQPIPRIMSSAGIARPSRAGQFAALQEEHPVAVGRYVAEAARARQDDPEIETSLTKLDEELSRWWLAAGSCETPAPRKLSN